MYMEPKRFVEIVKESMKTFFKENGYSKCHSTTGRLRTIIFFEKKVDNYEIPIAIQLMPLLDGVSFTVYFLNVRLCEIQEKNNWNWTFNDENELKQKLELVKGKCIKENFFVRVEERAKKYFIGNDPFFSSAVL